VSINQKIFALAGAFAFAVVGVGGYGLTHMAELGNDVAAVSDQSMTLTEASWTLHRISTGQLRQSIHFERALRAATGRGHGEAHEAEYAAEREAFARLGAELALAIDVGEAEVQTALLRPLGAERAKIEELRVRLIEVSDQQRAFTEQVDAVFALIDDGAVSHAVVEAEKVGAGIAFDFELAGLIADVRASTGETVAGSQRKLDAGRAGLLLLTAFAAMMSLIAWSLMGRSIVAPLAEIGRFAEAVAKGKRDVAFPRVSSSETGGVLQAMELMMSSLETAEEATARKQRDLDGAFARIGDQNRRLHALERDLAQSPAAPGPREIVGPQRRSDT